MGNRVAIITPSFFDPEGKRVQMGGGERYAVDLSNLLIEMGYDPELIQPANRQWKKSYKNIVVTGLPNQRCLFGPDTTFYRNFNLYLNRFDHVIYFRFDFAAHGAERNSIGISHGIWWDYRGSTGDYWRKGRGITDLLKAVNNLSAVVSVDTNTINWVRTASPGLAEKMVYLPNYVDRNKFKAQEPQAGGFKVLFPRRAVSQRGFREALDAAIILTQKYPDIHFKFLGTASARVEKSISDMKSSRITIEHVDMDDMPRQYAWADVVLIPTIAAEGTSFSCLEAMASRRPVISSYVGGLGNLVIDNYNGLLIQPTIKEIIDAVLRLRGNRKLLKDLGLNAYKVSGAFDKLEWEERWKLIIQQTFEK